MGLGPNCHDLVKRLARGSSIMKQQAQTAAEVLKTLLVIHSSPRVQVPNNHALTQNLYYYNYYYPDPRYLIIGYMDPLGMFLSKSVVGKRLCVAERGMAIPEGPSTQ